MNAPTYLLPLSNRQRECLLWIARGKTYAEIAIILGIAPATVKTNLDATRYKLNCANLAATTALAVARGIITIAEIEAPYGQTE
jgi:LuxR family transcriptional activator of conjugal transfer of Ti plasmids